MSDEKIADIMQAVDALALALQKKETTLHELGKLRTAIINKLKAPIQ